MEPFYINDCALAAIATGFKARTLTEFRDRLEIIHPGCIYFHFWIARLRPSFEYEEHHNDFSYWMHDALHDDILAERIELLDPSSFGIETLRSMMIDIIDRRVDESDFLPIAHKNQQFHFIRSKIIVFKTQLKAQEPKDFVKILPNLSRSSIFFHFIDARRRTEGATDDFTVWLKSFGTKYEELIKRLHNIDPYFISLRDLQQKIVLTFNQYFINESS